MMQNEENMPEFPKRVLLLSALQFNGDHPLASFLGEYPETFSPYDQYFLAPLRKLFQEVEGYDYVRRLMDLGPLDLNRDLVATLARFRPDYLVWNTYNHEIGECVFRYAREHGTTVVAVMFDDEYRFDVYSRWWIPYVDVFVTNDPAAVTAYEQHGSRAVFMVPLSGERVLSEWAPVPKQYDVVFIGRPKQDRIAYVETLRQAGLEVTLFGKAAGRYLSLSEMNDVIRRSRIVLNFAKTIRGGGFGLKGRLFETCLAGGFLLAEQQPGLDRFYTVGREIVVFESAQELLRLTRYYLDHDRERERIARAGWERANAAYTATSFLQRSFAAIEAMLPELPRPPLPARAAPVLRRDYARHNLAVNRAFLAAGRAQAARRTLRLVRRYRWHEPELLTQSALCCLPRSWWPHTVRSLVRLKTAFKHSWIGVLLHRCRLVYWMDDSE